MIYRTSGFVGWVVAPAHNSISLGPKARKASKNTLGVNPVIETNFIATPRSIIIIEIIELHVRQI
jgi:hypothetical protein